LIINTIRQTVRLNQIAILLVRKSRPGSYDISKAIGLDKKDCRLLTRDGLLGRYLEKAKSPLSIDELSLLSVGGKNDFEKIFENMQKIGVSLCLPLINEKKLIGIIVLGSKISGGAYTGEDLGLLSTLANQAGIAISNARLYQQVSDFNQVLQSKVDKQTRELRAKAKELGEKNDKLNKVLEVKNEFLKIVNHQINTPLSIIKNSIFMVKNKSFTMEKGMAFIEEGVRRMEGVFNDFWRAFSVEGEGVKMDFQKVDMNRLAAKLVEDASLTEVVKSRKLKIVFKQAPALPKVKTDPVQVSQVLGNLLDNAITYTSAGNIGVKLAKAGKFVKVSVSDTGHGIDKKDFGNLFEKFYRTARAKQYRPGGSGLGLYIAKKIIQANGGELKLERSEVGKGTTFSFTVPIWK
jgi:signal transduction histidine kinase